MQSSLIVIVVALLIPLLGLLLEALLGHLRLRGYRDIAQELNFLAKALHGKLEREGEDIVLTGTLGRRKVVARFSHSEMKPELSLKVRVPVEFTLFCLPHKYPDRAGKYVLRGMEPGFDAIFRVASDHPKPAGFLLDYTDTAKDIRKLCNSANTLLALQGGILEFSEMTLATENAYRHVLAQMQLMVKIADAAARTSGTRSLPPESSQRNWLRFGYVSASVLLLGSTLVTAGSRRAERDVATPVSAPAQKSPNVLSSDLATIPGVQGWRLATASDFDPIAIAWMQEEGLPVKGSISFQSSQDGKTGKAYLLKPRNGAQPGNGTEWRLIILVDGHLKFDVRFPQLAMMSQVRRNALSNVEWSGRPPAGEPEGDGVLVVWHINEPQSSTLFFANGSRILFGDLKDYHSIALQ